MTQHLLGADGQLDVMTEADAKSYYHLFSAGVYFFPLLGALLADALLGKYRTILSLSIVYCFGHLALAIDETRLGLALGLTLIAVGSGGIKSCVSAHVGDQFGNSNQHLLEKVFGWFYFSINLGAFASTILTPKLLEQFGPSVAFGVPGVLMALATLVFWMGRHRFVHIPAGGVDFLREMVSSEGLRALAKLSVLYVFVAMFWALYDQTGSSWVLQARHMDRHLAGIEWLPSQIQAINPILIMLMIPLFSYGIYPALGRVIKMTPLRKVALGLFLTAGSFALVATVEHWIAAGHAPSIGWQLLAYVIITAGEVMVSITCLEFSYTQAPKRMKSLVMGLYFMSISAGNVFTSAVNALIQNDDGTSKLSGPSYFWFFAGVMLGVALLFLVVVRFYRPRTYIQDEVPA
jgi:POT family proton-dependent oligopeptide transporter